MSELRISGVDRTVQETHVLLKEVSEELGEASRQDAYHALRAALFTLRDRLTTDEAFDFSAQLPALVRGIFFEGYRPAHKPLTYRHREEFLSRVAQVLEAGNAELDPERAVRAVLRVLQRHVSEGEMKQVRHMLPQDVQALWPD